MKIGLVACTARKEDKTMPVEKLYSRSPLFRYAVAFCKHNYNAVYALSAKHGLLPLTDVIEPYDENLMNKHGKELKDWYRLVTETNLKGYTARCRALLPCRQQAPKVNRLSRGKL